MPAPYLRPFFFLLMLMLSSPISSAREQLASLSLAGWQKRIWESPDKAVSTPLAPAETLSIPVELPGRQEFVQPDPGAFALWQQATHLQMEFRVPEGLPESARLVIFTRDKDFLWRQNRRPLVRPPGGILQLRLPIRNREAEQAWEGKGHQRPWNPLSPKILLEYGFAIESETGATETFSGQIELLSAALWKYAQAGTRHEVYDLAFRPRQPRIGQRIEFSFRLSNWPLNPFQQESADIQAEITLPNGQKELIRAFYHEDFLYDSSQWDKTRCLSPAGSPQWKIRFCPRLEGTHSVRILGCVDKRKWSLPPLEFRARGNIRPWHGFVRTDPKHRAYLQFEDETPFWGLGVNVRSPFDQRYQQVAPYSTWQDMGLAAYDHLFPKYRQHGINVVEVWMSSWWLALEWIHDAPGFHGVGHFNQYRAWMLDHILRLAEENDIYLILVLNNHGKFGTTYDTEWARNPYNKANGGFLENCEDYYTSEEAKAAFRATADYIVARWGASPNLLSWKLFTEVDLTGPSIEFYHHPSVAAWHAEMGSYLKKIDPYKHPVTTHWMLGYHRINDAIANLPELDFLSTDAYYNPGGGTEALVNMLKTGVLYGQKWNKPLVITEYGGSSYADNMGNLMKQVEIGLWTGLFNEAGILPMYWWFALLEDKNLYHHFDAVNRFASNEDRRGLERNEYRLDNGPLSVNEMRSPERYYAWLFDTEYYFTEQENRPPALHSDKKLMVDHLQPGSYALEIWNSRSGEILHRENRVISEAKTPLSIPLPEFRQSLAVKLKRIPEE
ncbi:MAG: hypothetical protein PHY82_04775 [Lentisphaeria bacterium]|nr:hypothetical protein [Lentisphaeria bacterium]